MISPRKKPTCRGFMPVDRQEWSMVRIKSLMDASHLRFDIIKSKLNLRFSIAARQVTNLRVANIKFSFLAPGLSGADDTPYEERRR